MREWTRARRGRWNEATEMSEPWEATVPQAGIAKGTVPYALRHSSIVRALRVGLPVQLVANLHDTSAKMIEQHYGAYIVDALDEIVARAVVPMTSAPIAQIRPAG